MAVVHPKKTIWIVGCRLAVSSVGVLDEGLRCPGLRVRSGQEPSLWAILGFRVSGCRPWIGAVPHS